MRYATEMSGACDFYAVLGVAPDSDPVVIRAAYRALMLKYHPDTSKAPDAAERARQINEAFAVLNDPAKRSAYDQSRSSRKADAGSAPPRQPPPDPARTARSEPQRLPSGAGHAWRWGAAAVGLLVVAAAVGSGRQESGAEPTIETMDITSNLSAVELAAAVGDAPSPPSVPTIGELVNAAAPPPVRFEDVEAGARDFARTLSRAGMAGARARSVKCHQNAGADWSSLDRCAAFDKAAHLVDQQWSRSSGGAPNAYFAFTQVDPVANYSAASTDVLHLRTRLIQIAEGVEPATVEAMARAIAALNRSEKPQPAERVRTVAETIAAGDEPPAEPAQP